MGNGNSRGNIRYNHGVSWGFTESGIAEDTNVPFGEIPNGSFVIVDSFRHNSQLPDFPIFNYISRFNVPFVVHAVLPLEPIIYVGCNSK